MIDIHTHILPGLDDGARDMEDSLSMAALALKSGVHTLVATSHARGIFQRIFDRRISAKIRSV